MGNSILWKGWQERGFRLHRTINKASIVVEFTEKRYGVLHGILIGYRECDETMPFTIKTFAWLMEKFRESVSTLYELPAFLENGAEDLLDKQKIFARNSLVEKE